MTLDADVSTMKGAPMKLALILAALTLSTVAHAKDAPPGDAPGFFDLQKAMVDSDEGKKNAADEKADAAAKETEVTKAQDAAKAADAICAKDPMHGMVNMEARRPLAKACVDAEDKHRATEDLWTRDQQAITQRQQTDSARLADRINRVLPAIVKAKRLSGLIPFAGVGYASPAFDQTPEVVRRLNAGEGKPPEVTAEENAKLKAEIVAKDAEIARLTKPAPPTVPPAPPIQPAHVAKK